MIKGMGKGTDDKGNRERRRMIKGMGKGGE